MKIKMESETASDYVMIVLSDSLPAIRLTLGIDVRKEEREILREIDLSRKALLKNGFSDHLIHVRSHRNVPVPLNSLADFYAGGFAFAMREEHHKKEHENCPAECSPSKLCPACVWNFQVNEFVKTLHVSRTHFNFLNIS